MSKVKLAIIYYSSTGTNYQAALEAQKAAEKAGAEVRLRKVAELAPNQAIDNNPAWRKHLNETKDVSLATNDDLNWADAVIFGTPTRFGNVSSQLKQFMDGTGGLWFEGKLANKVYSAFTSAQNPNGGQESTLLALYNTIHHWGGILVTPGYTDQNLFKSGGNPYGSSITADGNEITEEKLEAIRIQTLRVVEFASKLK
jgi:NAD(P)H dehydrogenase (quinone)